MKRRYPELALTAILLLLLSSCLSVRAGADGLSSWNDGPAKKAITEFVRATTDQSSPKFVPPEDRIATFDQDGTTWTSHPMYTQVVFAFDRVTVLAPQHPEWKTTAPFSCVLSGDKAAMAKFTMKDLETIFMATHTGMRPGSVPGDRE